MMGSKIDILWQSPRQINLDQTTITNNDKINNVHSKNHSKSKGTNENQNNMC